MSKIKIVSCLKGKEIENLNVKANEDNITIKILGTESMEIDLDKIPSIKIITDGLEDNVAYYTQIRNMYLFSIKRF